MHVGFWGMAVIVIVIASWLMYRYLAPQSWKEWTRAGVLQAFIIAFYAEMYGFPLTIYFLARFFGLDVAWTKNSDRDQRARAAARLPARGLVSPATQRFARTRCRSLTRREIMKLLLPSAR
jgi:hypothetical protein